MISFQNLSFPTYGQSDGFFVTFTKCRSVIDYKGQITSAACAGHFPGANLGKSTIGFDGLLNIVVILFGMTNVCWTNNPRKHRGLSLSLIHI